MAIRKLTKKLPKASGREAPFAYAGLERIFHERGRLAICTCLVAHPDGVSFTELHDACGLTDGNLSRHLSALAEMGVVSVTKIAGEGRPTTMFRITARGKARFLNYIDELEAVVRAVHTRARESNSADRSGLARLATT
jgi:predicted ArsR family transcriptional regulator